MTVEERLQVAEQTFSHCVNILKAKGKSYAGDKDTLMNFKRNAEHLGLSKYQILQVYFNKHIDSINNAIKENPNFPEDHSEGMEGRIYDVINYAILLQCMLIEDQNNPLTKPKV